MVGRVVVMQHYRNNSDMPIEAKYVPSHAVSLKEVRKSSSCVCVCMWLQVFPLDELGAVCGFEAFINGKHIIGQVKEKEQAHKEYQQVTYSFFSIFLATH
jgi:poly [ADP-ribose] polymerase